MNPASLGRARRSQGSDLSIRSCVLPVRHLPCGSRCRISLHPKIRPTRAYRVQFPRIPFLGRRCHRLADHVAGRSGVLACRDGGPSDGFAGHCILRHPIPIAPPNNYPHRPRRTQPIQPDGSECYALLASIENHFRLACHPPQNRRAPSESIATSVDGFHW
jgi:hypothetical protein